MKAAILEKGGTPLTIADVSLAPIGPREVRVRTAAAGLCHTDLHCMEGNLALPLPIVLGHEAAGIVEAVGRDVTRFRPGEHVVGCLSVYCGTCEHCLSGDMAQCANPATKIPPGVAKRLNRDGKYLTQGFNLGAFAEEMLVHENAIVKIRKDMPLDLAALVGCAVLTGTGSVIRTAKVPPGATVVVIGCGGVGLSAIMGAKLCGALRIIAIDLLPSKLALATELGATDVVNAVETDPVEAVLEMTGGGVNFVFECIGNKRAVEQGFHMLASGGALTLMGSMPDGVDVSFPGREIFRRQRRILGSLMGSNRFPVDIPRLVEFYMQGRLPLDKLVSRRIGLNEINDGFRALSEGAVTRSVITFDL